MTRNLSSQFSANGKTLNAFCMSLHSDELPDWLAKEIKEAFVVLAPHIKDDNQVLYMRDIASLAIKGKYAGGHCYNRYEAMIAVPNWNTGKQHIVAAINHELHHMARWQNAGYGQTLGGAILSEGIATYYEELQSGWTSPWSQASFTADAITQAAQSWDNLNYDHSDWFFQGSLGEWVGYGIGYNLAKQIFKDDFNLAQSVTVQPAEVKYLLNKLG